jgi:hypothetical protein
VLRAAGETETTQGNIQDWLQLDKGDPGFQLLTEEGFAAVNFISISTSYIITFTIYYVILSIRATIRFNDTDHR